MLLYPFKPFNSPIAQERIKNGKQFGDPFKNVKENYMNYDVVISNVGSHVFLELLNPELIQDFYGSNQHLTFQKIPVFVTILGSYIGNGLLFAEGEEWKKKKKILTNVFNHDFIVNLIPQIEEICESSMKNIEDKYEKTDYKFEMIELTTTIFSRIVIECFFGFESANELINGKSIAENMRDLLAIIYKLRSDLMIYFLGAKVVKLGLRKNHRKLKKEIKIFREWGLNFVKRRIKTIEDNLEEVKKKKSKDMIEIFIVNNNLSKGSSEGYDESQILEEFMLFFLAGTETTSNFVQVMVDYIAKNPKIETKLREEIDAKMPSEDYTLEKLKEMKYIECLQKETSRIFGPTTTILPRVATKDCFLKGIPVKKGTYLTPRFNANYFSEKYF